MAQFNVDNKSILNLKRSLYRESYYDFFKAFWHTVVHDDFIENWHIRYLCDELQIVGEWVINRQPKQYDLIINISPGESKTTLATVLFHPWLWCRDASIRGLSVSHSGPLAIDHASLSRDCIGSELYQQLFGAEVKVRKDIDSKTVYKTSKGGKRQIAGVGMKVTGTHFHIITVDDAVDPQGVLSIPVLEKSNRFVGKTLSTRKVDKRNTPLILIMQRLHENDPTGDLLAKGTPVKHICLPATTEYPINPPELKANYVDGVMNPSRTDAAVLATTLLELGPNDFACQFGQQPGDPEGNKIKKEWWRYFLRQNMPTHLVWDIWIDGAYTDNTANDPTGLTVAAFDDRNRLLYIRHAESFHLEMPAALARIAEVAAIHGCGRRSRLFFEPKASGKSFKQMINNLGDVEGSAVEIKSSLIHEGKEARISVSSPKVHAGQVWILACPETQILTHENEQYPKAEHDEHVDNLGYMCDYYFDKPKKKKANRRN